MGCNSTREIIESKMLALKLKRIDIQEERENKIKDLEKITGKKQHRKEIEDYVCSSSSSSEEEEENSSNSYSKEKKKKKYKNKKHHKKRHQKKFNSKTTFEYSDFDDYNNENSYKNVYNFNDDKYKKMKHKKYKSEIKRNIMF